MSKNPFDLEFEHLFKEAVQESYELANKLPILSIKHSWEMILRKMEEQDPSN